jgi:hypothetical protein
MSITSIGRYFVGDPNIVSIVTDNTLTEITTTGYLELPDILADIELLQNGDFQWNDTDLVLIHYSPDLIGFFVRDALNNTFDALAPSGGLANTLQNGDIFVGNAGNVATGVTPSGDITLSNTGVFGIAAGVIVDADINAAAAIAFSKLAALPSADILVGSAGNVATAVALSGDATLSNAGALTIANNAITTAKILNANVTLAKLAAGITPSHIIKFANQVTTVGGAAAEAFTVTGAVAATDRAFVQMVDNGTNNVTVLQAVVTANTLTVTFSADPGNDAVINYQLIRAAS